MDTTKESIMAVAMRLFAEKGLNLVAVREICKAANVNVALVNYYFHNKNGLYKACVERLFHENTGDELCAIDSAVSDARSWREAVRGWIFGVSRALRATQGGTGCGRLLRAGGGTPGYAPLGARWRGAAGRDVRRRAVRTGLGAGERRGRRLGADPRHD